MWPMLVNIYMKTRENILNILKVKIYFQGSALCKSSLVINICVKFHKNILNSFNVIEGQDLVAESAIYKVQRGVTKKIHT